MAALEQERDAAMEMAASIRRASDRKIAELKAEYAEMAADRIKHITDTPAVLTGDPMRDVKIKRGAFF